LANHQRSDPVQKNFIQQPEESNNGGSKSSSLSAESAPAMPRAPSAAQSSSNRLDFLLGGESGSGANVGCGTPDTEPDHASLFQSLQSLDYIQVQIILSILDLNLFYKVNFPLEINKLICFLGGLNLGGKLIKSGLI
jgi:hypothetical protein